MEVRTDNTYLNSVSFIYLLPFPPIANKRVMLIGKAAKQRPLEAIQGFQLVRKSPKYAEKY